MEKKTKSAEASSASEIRTTGVRAGAELATTEGGVSGTRLRVNKAYKMFVGGAFVK